MRVGVRLTYSHVVLVERVLRPEGEPYRLVLLLDGKKWEMCMWEFVQRFRLENLPDEEAPPQIPILQE